MTRWARKNSAPSSSCISNRDRCSRPRTRPSAWSIARSEERRVGKECRSRCDWSSDVCSSDLDDAVGTQKFGAFVELHIEQGPLLEAENKTIGVVDREIGRASCRERV